MRVLVLESALGRCLAAVVRLDDADDGADGGPDGGPGAASAGTIESRIAEPRRIGHAAVLPAMARDVLAAAGGPIDLIGVTVGPGSFTGIRAGLALAHGIALGAGVPVVGVTVGEAIAESLPHLGARELWVATEGRRGHVFLERGGLVASVARTALPAQAVADTVAVAVAVAGGAANDVAARLAARGIDVMLTDARLPLPVPLARAAARRHAGALPPREPYPVYVDPPEAHPPAGGLRPPPVPAA